MATWAERREQILAALALGDDDGEGDDAESAYRRACADMTADDPTSSSTND